MTQILVECPSPKCPGRSVEGETVNRETWEAWWHEGSRQTSPGEWSKGTIHCPRCSTEGIDPESGQLDSAEEEFGPRCESCGIVTAESQRDFRCPHCDEYLPA